MIDLTALQKHIDMLARSPRSNATTLEYLVQCRDEIMRMRNGLAIMKGWKVSHRSDFTHPTSQK